MNASEWINYLNLLPHPEGGYYKETYRCNDQLSLHGTNDKRNISTAIFFLLDGKDKSHLHKIKSDELWFFHEGATLEIFFQQGDSFKIILLGKNPKAGESLQAVIPAGCWFGSRVKEAIGYSLVSCTVAPGFDFNDFELAKKSELLPLYPGYAKLIEEMCVF
jgi:predicted cupin superfamily sugar epimerase